MARSPALGVSEPAISIRVEVLPEPLGPSSVRNSPEWMSSETPSTAATRSYRFSRSVSDTAAPLPAAFAPFSSAAIC